MNKDAFLDVGMMDDDRFYNIVTERAKKAVLDDLVGQRLGDWVSASLPEMGSELRNQKTELERLNLERASLVSQVDELAVKKNEAAAAAVMAGSHVAVGDRIPSTPELREVDSNISKLRQQISAINNKRSQVVDRIELIEFRLGQLERLVQG